MRRRRMLALLVVVLVVVPVGWYLAFGLGHGSGQPAPGTDFGGVNRHYLR
ncbi:MAG TPA: hypothetical protein VII51_03555 [Gaiellaceae bacterium]